MARRRRAGFGDVSTTKEAFAKDEARCPNCRRPIGPRDEPTYVPRLGGGEPTLATMRCGRCGHMITLHFQEGNAEATA